jgi:hypothetical protein
VPMRILRPATVWPTAGVGGSVVLAITEVRLPWADRGVLPLLPAAANSHGCGGCGSTAAELLIFI